MKAVEAGRRPTKLILKVIYWLFDGWGFFLSLVPPQKVLSLHLKTKPQADPSYSQLSVSKANTALSTGLVLGLAGKFPSPVGGLSPADFGPQVFPLVWDQKDLVCESR